jgi:hypothetical protein
MEIKIFMQILKTFKRFWKFEIANTCTGNGNFSNQQQHKKMWHCSSLSHQTSLKFTHVHQRRGTICFYSHMKHLLSGQRVIYMCIYIQTERRKAIWHIDIPIQNECTAVYIVITIALWVIKIIILLTVIQVLNQVFQLSVRISMVGILCFFNT